MRKICCMMLVLFMCSLSCACTGVTIISENGQEVSVTPLPTLPAVPEPTGSDGQARVPACQSDGVRDISAWAVYWDTNDVPGELSPYAERLAVLSYFEAFFSEDGCIILPEEVEQLYANIEYLYPGNRWKSYLTFVNDMRYDNGEFDLKSTELVAPFLSDEAAMDAHVDALVGFALEKGFDGIEIDYEALRKAPELWGPFTVFCTRLYERTEQEGLGLRIILEPTTPFADYAFPCGPDYVIMCYNLHGGHSAPGPKADFDFLSELMEQSSALPGKRIFALATGGYDWDAHENASQVTLRKASELYLKRGVDRPVRYTESMALSFKYKDEENVTHTVWCADTQTLEAWSSFFRDAGFDELAYWRLGGNYFR